MLPLCKEIVLIAHLVSTHFASGYNNENYGLGVECRTEQVQLAVGTYRNSYEKQSAYAVVGREFWRSGVFAVGAVAGVVSGYEKQMAAPVLVGARVSLQLGRAQIGVFGYPPAGEVRGLAHLTFGWRF